MPPLDRTPQTGPDPLEMELFRYAVESVVDELDVNITRTAHSPLVYEYKDYSVGLVTGDFRLLSQSRYNLPIFLADLGEPVRDAVEVIGEDRVEPGDIFITNFNPANGSHLNNVISASPIFADDRIVGYVTIRTHWPDVGGLVPGSLSWNSRSIFHEGVQYRGLKLVSRGRIVPEVLATIQANSWMPELVTGDAMANVAACTLGVARWHEQIASRWSQDEVDALVAAQFGASAALARERVAALPDGIYTAATAFDDGNPGSPSLPLSLSILVEGDRMVVDLSGLPPQVEAPINSGAKGGAVSAMRVAFKSLLAPERPADHGLFEPLEVVIPPGTVMSAEGNAPMSMWNILPPTMIDLFLRAIGERLPELVPAGHFAAQATVGLLGVDEKGRWWMASNAGQGGFGATSDADGFGPVMTYMHGDNPRVQNEIIEGRYPVRVLEHKIRRNAGGRGLHRGGPGFEIVMEALEDMYMSTLINRTRTPAWGLAGGEPGRPCEIHKLEPGAARWKRIGQVSQAPVTAGTRFRVRGGGGGGWGTPPARGS